MANEDKIMSLLETLVSEQQRTNERLDRLESDVSDVKARAINIEHEHGRRLRALLDGYSALYDIDQEIRSDVATIKSRQDKQEIILKYHSDIADDNS
ncbi:MAG: hypothetical protein LBK41_09610 [Clostridiales bacterium]|nr:hypothetical protein [Clostridiales bacterium]